MQDWQLPLGRRFRALKLWFVLRTYGAAGLRDYIAHKEGLASHFAGLVRGDDRFELTAPPRFGLVCLRVKVRIPEILSPNVAGLVHGDALFELTALPRVCFRVKALYSQSCELPWLFRRQHVTSRGPTTASS